RPAGEPDLLRGVRGRVHVGRRDARMDRGPGVRPSRGFDPAGGRPPPDARRVGRPGSAAAGTGRGHRPVRPARGRPVRRRPRGARAACPRQRPIAQGGGGGSFVIDLTGKSAVVTGGSRGIGRAIVMRLAEQGADVAFSYRGNEIAAGDTALAVEALGRKAVANPGDVTKPEAAEALIAAALGAFGKADILVNNAGITRDDLIMRMSIDHWREVLETNLFGAFYTTKAVMRPMLKARAGRIVNITSVSGQAGNAGQANYSSAKAGLIGLTKATAREVA